MRAPDCARMECSTKRSWSPSCAPFVSRSFSLLRRIPRGNLCAQRYKLAPGGTAKRSEHEPGGSTSAERARDRIESAWWEAGAFRDGVYRLPRFRIELRLESVEPAKVVEPRSV